MSEGSHRIAEGMYVLGRKLLGEAVLASPLRFVRERTSSGAPNSDYEEGYQPSEDFGVRTHMLMPND